MFKFSSFQVSKFPSFQYFKFSGFQVFKFHVFQVVHESQILRLLRPEGGPVKIADDILLGMKRVRALTKSLLQGAADLEPEELEQLVLAKKSLLVNYDPSFVIELQLLKKMQQDGGVEFVKEQVEGMMHTADSAEAGGLGVKHEELKALKLWPCWKFLSDKAQSCLTEIIRYMDDMKLGTTPDVVTMRKEAFLTRVLASFENFCVYDVNGAAAAKAKAEAKPKAASSRAEPKIVPKLLVGKPAFDKFFEVAEKKERAKEISLEDMDPLHVYIWLASDEQKTEIQRITGVIYGAATGTAAKNKSTGKTPQSSKKAKMEEKDDDPLMELFK